MWVKGKVSDTDKSDQPLYVCIGGTGYKWLGNSAEISLTEPQPEKVEVSQEFADWVEKVMTWKHDSSWAVKEIAGYGWGSHMHDPETGEELKRKKYHWVDAVQDNKEKHIKAIYDGYTVKPKRWVVKNHDGLVFSGFYGGGFTVLPRFTKEENCYYKFTDHAKAEAVATLVEGSVEEV